MLLWIIMTFCQKSPNHIPNTHTKKGRRKLINFSPNNFYDFAILINSIFVCSLLLLGLLKMKYLVCRWLVVVFVLLCCTQFPTPLLEVILYGINSVIYDEKEGMSTAFRKEICLISSSKSSWIKQTTRQKAIGIFLVEFCFVFLLLK